MSEPSGRSSRLASRKAAQRIHQQFTSPWEPIRYHPCDTRTTATKYERTDTGYKAGGHLYKDNKSTSRPTVRGRGRPRKNQIPGEEEGVTHVWDTYVAPRRDPGVRQEKMRAPDGRFLSKEESEKARRQEKLSSETDQPDQSTSITSDPPAGASQNISSNTPSRPSPYPMLNPPSIERSGPSAYTSPPLTSRFPSKSSKSSESTSGPSIRLFSSTFQPTQQPLLMHPPPFAPTPASPASTPSNHKFDLLASPTRAVPGILKTYSNQRTESSMSSCLPTATQDFRFWMNQNLPPSARDLEEAEAHLIDEPSDKARAAKDKDSEESEPTDRQQRRHQGIGTDELKVIKGDVFKAIEILLNVRKRLEKLPCH